MYYIKKWLLLLINLPGCGLSRLSLLNINPLRRVWPSVFCTGPDDSVIGALLLDVGSPACEPGHNEYRGK